MMEQCRTGLDGAAQDVAIQTDVRHDFGGRGKLRLGVAL